MREKIGACKLEEKEPAGAGMKPEADRGPTLHCPQDSPPPGHQVIRLSGPSRSLQPAPSQSQRAAHRDPSTSERTLLVTLIPVNNYDYHTPSILPIPL